MATIRVRAGAHIAPQCDAPAMHPGSGAHNVTWMRIHATELLRCAAPLRSVHDSLEPILGIDPEDFPRVLLSPWQKQVLGRVLTFSNAYWWQELRRRLDLSFSSPKSGRPWHGRCFGGGSIDEWKSLLLLPPQRPRRLLATHYLVQVTGRCNWPGYGRC